MTRDFHFPGRSLVRAVNGVVATSQPLASQAGLEMLREGGTAVDAVVAAAAALACVEPFSTGPGGDVFAMLASPSGALRCFNGSGRAPKGASVAAARGRGLRVLTRDCVEAITLPGAVDAWLRLLEDGGRLDPARVLAPAVRLAEEGFAATEVIAREWALCASVLDEEGARIFLPDGRPPRAGQRVRLPALAALLREIGTKGRAAFYEGSAAAAMVGRLRGLGGVHTEEDFAQVAGDYAAPLGVPYGGAQVWEAPPNSQGVTALVMLRVMEALGLSRHAVDSPQRWHGMIETARAAYGLRDSHLGEGAAAQAAAEAMIDPALARDIAARMDMNRARLDTPLPPLGRGDTVLITAVDKDGAMASLVNSLYHGFGSGVGVASLGVVFHNRGLGFSLEPESSAPLVGGARPRHTIIPAMLKSAAGKPLVAFGVMGGDYQPMGHAALLANVLDYGMDWQEAIDAARLMPMGRGVEVERGFDAKVLAGLAAMGHRLRIPDLPLGGAQAAGIEEATGTLFAASDSRKDGAACGY